MAARKRLLATWRPWLRSGLWLRVWAARSGGRFGAASDPEHRQLGVRFAAAELIWIDLFLRLGLVEELAGSFFSLPRLWGWGQLWRGGQGEELGCLEHEDIRLRNFFFLSQLPPGLWRRAGLSVD